MTIEEINDRQKFLAMWESDEIAEASDPSYKAPDGELFRIAYIKPNRVVVADSGRWFTPSEFEECERVAA